MKWEMSVVDSSGCHFICGGHSVLSNLENSGRKIQELLVSSKSIFIIMRRYFFLQNKISIFVVTKMLRDECAHMYPKCTFSDFLAYSDTQCCRVVAQPLRLSKIHGRVLTTLFNAIVCFPKGIELSISFVVRGKVTKQPFHHFDKNVFSLLSFSSPDD